MCDGDFVVYVMYVYLYNVFIGIFDFFFDIEGFL